MSHAALISAGQSTVKSLLPLCSGPEQPAETERGQRALNDQLNTRERLSMKISVCLSHFQTLLKAAWILEGICSVTA